MNPLNENFVREEYDASGVLVRAELVCPEYFTVAHDVVDAIAEREPERRAMVWLNPQGDEHVFTFADMARHADKTAAYLSSLGIRKGDGPGTAEEMAEAIRGCIDAGKGVFGMKAFGGGNLSGHYREALDYVRGLGVHSIMVGMGRFEEIDRLAEWAEGTLPADYVPDITFKKIRIDPGDCEGCGTCIRRCPNGAIRMGDDGIAVVDHAVCLTCGYCAPVCPVRAIIMW